MNCRQNHPGEYDKTEHEKNLHEMDRRCKNNTKQKRLSQGTEYSNMEDIGRSPTVDTRRVMTKKKLRREFCEVLNKRLYQNQ